MYIVTEVCKSLRTTVGSLVNYIITCVKSQLIHEFELSLSNS